MSSGKCYRILRGFAWQDITSDTLRFLEMLPFISMKFGKNIGLILVELIRNWRGVPNVANLVRRFRSAISNNGNCIRRAILQVNAQHAHPVSQRMMERESTFASAFSSQQFWVYHPLSKPFYHLWRKLPAFCQEVGNSIECFFGRWRKFKPFEPPPLNWSSAMFRKRRTENGE